MTDDLSAYDYLKGTVLYNVSSKTKLAKLLFTSKKTLNNLYREDDPYNCWTIEKKNGESREISDPLPGLKKIQKRLASLLQGVKKLDYLMAPLKNRSYVSNAALHSGSQSFRLLDIEDFFPSFTQKKFFGFLIVV